MTESMNFAPRRWRAVAGFLAFAWSVGCGDGGITDPIIEANPDIRAYVTDSAAVALDATGRFHINPDAAPDLESVPVIPASYARSLATGFLKSFGPGLQFAWERDRGGRIDLAALTVSPRVYPAETAFGPVPDVGCHPAFVHLFGSYYLMTYDRGTVPQLRVAVSVQLTDYSVNGEGYVVYPPRSGQGFLVEAIPVDNSLGVLLSPEQAIAIAAQATGAKIRRVPRLVLQGADHTPNVALWRMDLDGPITIRRADNSSDTTSVLYVGPNQNARLNVAVRTQPTSVTISCHRVDENLVESGFTDVTVPVLNGQPIKFEPVTILP